MKEIVIPALKEEGNNHVDPNNPMHNRTWNGYAKETEPIIRAGDIKNEKRKEAYLNLRNAISLIIIRKWNPQQEIKRRIQTHLIRTKKIKTSILFQQHRRKKNESLYSL
jgi:hypothetical protein